MTRNAPNSDRRDFLKKAAASSAAVVAAGQARGADRVKKPEMPMIALGKYSISRLVIGSNPFNGGSHPSTFVNREMKQYHTTEQILKTLRRGKEVGVNCWQISGSNAALFKRFADEGLGMHGIVIASGNPAGIKTFAQAGCVGIAHHGESTDNLFKSGKIEKVGDYLKQTRDAGLLAGVSSHMPDAIDAVESKGWHVDYYMTCVYERHRNDAALKKLLGRVPIPPGEVYLREDPARMFKVVRQTKRPCLAFKILAAGRLSDRRQWVEAAFRETFAGIKPTDGVILGIYDRYSDQVGENARLTVRYGTPGAKVK